MTINLGRAAPFAALAPSGITNTGATVLHGDLGTTGTSVTGFPPGVITGTLHVNDNVASGAQSDSAAAFTYGQGLTPTVNMAGTTTMGGSTLVAGIYEYDTGVGIAGTLTLDGKGVTDGVWIFQLAKTLITSTSSSVSLVNGAQASNVFWIVGSSATLGTYSTLVGSILASASVTAMTSSTVDGGLYAGASVSFDTATITP